MVWINKTIPFIKVYADAYKLDYLGSNNEF